MKDPQNPGPQPGYLPTPAEIRAACDEILAADTPAERLYRLGYRVTADYAGDYAYTVPTVRDRSPRVA